MCKILNCRDPRPLCFHHSIEVDDLVEYFVDENYTNSKIIECLDEYTRLYSSDVHIYRVGDRWINASSLYDLCLQNINNLDFCDYTNRIILEECVILTFGNKGFQTIFNHIIKNVEYKMIY